MADSEGYVPQYDFSGFQATNPAKPLPGHELDVELQNIADAVGQTNAALNDIRRSDGKLKSGIVTPESAAPGFIESVAGLAYGALEAIDGYGAELSHFSQTWLGARAEDPATGLAGAPLYAGQMYYNTVAGEYRTYDGTTWQFHTGVSQIDTYSFVAASGQTTFSGLDDAGHIVAVATGTLLVTVNGSGPLLEGPDYEVTAGGDGITFAVERTLGDRVQITSFRQLNISNVAPQVAADADRAEDAAAAAGDAASAAAASALAIGGRFFASEAAFKAAPVDPLVDMVFIRNGNTIIPYSRDPNAAGPEGLLHPDGSKWAKGILTPADLEAAFIDALTALETYPDPAGTFTPTLTFATPGTLAVTYGGIQRGWYQRIGDLVFATVNLNTATIAKGSATGNLRLAFADLPFTPSANSMGTGTIRAKNALLVPPDGARIISLHVVPGQKYLEFAYMGSAGGVNYLTNSHVTDGAMVLQLAFQFEVV